MTDVEFDFPEDIFDDQCEAEPGDFLRTGRWNRPRVRPPVIDSTGRWVSNFDTDRTVDYPRVTTICDQLSAGPGLTYYKVHHTALAVARASRGVRLTLAGKEYGDPYVQAYVEQAMTEARFNEKANLGTAVGRLVEPGCPRDFLDPTDDADIISDVQGFDVALRQHGMKIVDTQVLCVNDDIKVAGTIDFLVQLPDPYIVTWPHTGLVVDVSGAVVIGDAKRSGGFHPIGWATQEAAYARSTRYDEKTEVRSPLHEKFDPRVGIVFWIEPGTGITHISCLDLELGWQLMKLAKIMHAQGKDGKHLATDAPMPEGDPILTAIGGIENDEDLRSLWNSLSEADQLRYFEDVQDAIRRINP